MGVFFRREVVFGNQLWGDGGFGHGKNKMIKFTAKNSLTANHAKYTNKAKPKYLFCFRVFRGYDFWSLFS
jgi:hypothetical protein